MKITQAEWNDYVEKLSLLSDKASEDFKNFANKNGGWENIDRQILAEAGWTIASKYSEGSSALAAEMYDAIARAEKAKVPPAELSADIEFGTVAKAINGALKHSTNDDFVASTVGRAVKQAGADTMLKNASRDGAEFAWIPSGDTCAFCLVLASNGWRRASKKTTNGGHAEHIHTHCNCQFAIRFNKDTNVVGYEPDELQRIYYNAEGGSYDEKIKSLRKEQKKVEKTTNNGKIKEKDFTDYANKHFDRKIQASSYAEDIVNTNPNYGKPGYNDNCQRTVPAYRLRRDGFDVIANPSKFGNNDEVEKELTRSLHVAFENKETGKEPILYWAGNKSNGLNEIENLMRTMPNEAELAIKFSKNEGGAHYLVAKNDNNKVIFIDPQTAETNKDKNDLLQIIKQGETFYWRVDNAKVKDEYAWYIARNAR